MNSRPRSATALVVFTALAIAMVAAGCASSAGTRYQSPTAPEFRIAIAHLAQETNSFSPVPTTMADFQAHGIYRGEAGLSYALDGDNTLSGFADAPLYE